MKNDRVKHISWCLTGALRGALVVKTAPAVLLLTVSASLSAFAADLYWVGTAGANTNVAGNWNSAAASCSGAGDAGSAPSSSDVIHFVSDCTNNAAVNAALDVAGIDIASGYTGTITQNSGVAVTVGASNYSQAAGTFTGGDSDIDINGGLTITGGTMAATSASILITGNWQVDTSGGFTHNSGTVNFDGGAGTSTLNSAATFNDLTHSGAVTLQPATNDLTIAGDLNTSSSSGHFDNATNDKNINVTGNVTVDVGTTSMGDGTWTVSGTWNSLHSSGTFNSNSSTLVLDGSSKNFRGSSNATKYLANVTISGSYTLNGNTGVGGDLRVTGSLTGSSELRLAHQADIEDISGTLGWNLLTLMGSHAPGDGTGDVPAGDYSGITTVKFDDSSPSARTVTFNAGTYTFNHLLINSSQASGSYTFSSNTNNPSFVIEGNLTFTDTAGTTTYNKGTGTITFSGGSGTNTISAIGKSLEDLIINDSGDTKQLTSAIVTDALTVTAGTFDMNGQTFEFASATAASNSDTIQLIGTETLTSVNHLDTDSGTVVFVGDNSSGNLTIPDFVATDYYNLTINDANATERTFILGAALKVANDLTLTDGTFNDSDYAITVGGDLTVEDAVTLARGSGALTLSGTGTTPTFTDNRGTTGNMKVVQIGE